jgi:hypothetical protein
MDETTLVRSPVTYANKRHQTAILQSHLGLNYRRPKTAVIFQGLRPEQLDRFRCETHRWRDTCDGAYYQESAELAFATAHQTEPPTSSETEPVAERSEPVEDQPPLVDAAIVSLVAAPAAPPRLLTAA